MQNTSVLPLENPPKLLDQVRGKIHLKHYSIRTEQAYTDWIKRYILHFGKPHPRDMGASEVTQFLTHFPRFHAPRGNARLGRAAASLHRRAAHSCYHAARGNQRNGGQISIAHPGYEHDHDQFLALSNKLFNSDTQEPQPVPALKQLPISATLAS